MNKKCLLRFIPTRNSAMKIGLHYLDGCPSWQAGLENLNYALALHFAYYNFCRIHKTIRCTPAMRAGITKNIWEVKDLMDYEIKS